MLNYGGMEKRGWRALVLGKPIITQQIIMHHILKVIIILLVLATCVVTVMTGLALVVQVLAMAFPGKRDPFILFIEQSGITY